MRQHVLYLLFLLNFAGISLSAQVDLPYYSGFDNTAERTGWQIYRTGENALSNWSVATVGGFSPTSCISHDYAPSTGAGVADDWFVSPGFSISAGGMLDSVRYAFSGFSVPEEDDTIGIFLLTGSQNPASATSMTSLADFRGDMYIADGSYRLLEPVALPATQEMAYIAIRYRNAQVSSRWLTVQFDNVAIRGLSTGVLEPVSPLITTVYPNPCSDQLYIDHSADPGILILSDGAGCALRRCNITPGQSHSVLSMEGLAHGLYFITVEQRGSVSSRRVVKQ